MITEAMVEAAAKAVEAVYETHIISMHGASNTPSNVYRIDEDMSETLLFGPAPDEECRAFLTRLAQRAALLTVERAAWQPIETAPKDGTEILAWDGQDVYLIWWSDTIGLEDGTTGAFVDASMYFGKALTHWRPLPAPPLNDAPSSRGGET